ncbi:MAG: ROK family protein [Methanomicrobiales archaeon]|nr:ROK family protein [Methanomicrobiales archaeon]
MQASPPSADCVIAVDLGASWVRAAQVSPNGRIFSRIAAPTPRNGDSGGVVAAEVSRLIGMLQQGGDTVPCRAIGISAAGPLDVAGGAVVSPPNMPFARIDLAGPLSRRHAVPVVLLNDCRAGMLAERWLGAARGVDNAVYITFSTGIGGGALVNGTLCTGKNGNAGEIGHLFVDSRYGLICGCGGEGHWEAYASGTGIPRFFERWCAMEGIAKGALPATAAEVFAAAGRDPETAAFFEELGKINARGILGVVVAYEPALIILDGPVIRNHAAPVIEPLRRHYEAYLPLPCIALSPLCGDAPLLGAAAYALERSRH